VERLNRKTQKLSQNELLARRFRNGEFLTQLRKKIGQKVGFD
jgi:hypothetical protein